MKIIDPTIPEIEYERKISIVMLALGLVLAIVSFFSLRRLVIEVRRGYGFDFDKQFMGYVRRRASPWLTAMVQLITYSASVVSITVMSTVLAIAWWRSGHQGDAALVATTVIGSSGLGAIGKVYFTRPRPQFFPWLTGAVGWSFPSGHTLAAVTLGGLVAGLESRTHGIWQRIILWLAAGFWSSMVGVSRIYLGVHYPSDVLASISVGSLYLLFTFTVHWWITGKRPVTA